MKAFPFLVHFTSVTHVKYLVELKSVSVAGNKSDDTACGFPSFYFVLNFGPSAVCVTFHSTDLQLLAARIVSIFETFSSRWYTVSVTFVNVAFVETKLYLAC